MDDDVKSSGAVTQRPRTVSTHTGGSWMSVAGVAGNLGWMIAVPAVLFVMGGAWLDSYLGTKPVCTLLGIPLALTVSAMGVWRLIRQVQAEDQKQP